MNRPILITLLLFSTISSIADNFEDSLLSVSSMSYPGHHAGGGLNIYIISKDQYFDNVNRFIELEARIASLLHHRKLKVILAHSTMEAANRIEALVHKHHCGIDNLWFDSHGKYRKRYSSFMIGKDEYCYKNICDSDECVGLGKIAAYCDRYTNIGIGACYAAANFNFPTPDSLHMNMHGDDLLEGIGHIFKGSYIYGSESWVMAKPGMFGKRNALAGFPLEKEFKDVLFEPVWNRLGMWRRYDPLDEEVEDVNTVHLSRKADIRVEKNSYLSLKRARRKQQKNLHKLAPGRYKLIA